MNRTKKMLQNIYGNRRKILGVLMLILIIPVFQNCAGGFSSGSEAAGAGAIGSGSVGGTGIGTGGTGTADNGGGAGGGGDGQGLTLAELQQQCKTLITTPSLAAPSVTSVAVKSGLGSADSGDERNPETIAVSSNRGIKDINQFNALSCNAQFSLQLDCEVVENDTSRPIKINNAINEFGVNLLETRTQANLARGSFSANNCSVGFGVGADKVNISIRPNTQRQRCTDGTFTVRLTVRNAVTGQGAGFTSPPQYLSVRMNNSCWVESKLKDVSDLPAVGNFGSAVAINGAWAAIVSPTDDAGSVLDVGRIYMYKLEGSSWNLKQKIQIATAQARDTISSVAINGNRMVIGSPSPYPGGEGNAYYYTQTGDTWTLARQISPPVSQADQAFGHKVAINSNMIFVTAPGFNSGGKTKSGVVYVYNVDGLNLLQTLTGGTEAYTAFGSAIAVDGNVLAVGAPQAIGREEQGNGSVYVYTASGTSWSQAVVKTGSKAAEAFGSAIAVLGNRLAVGSPNYATGSNSAQGRVTIYNAYTDTTSTVKTGNTTGDRLGAAVALSSTGVYVGVPGAGSRTGRVDHYLYGSLGTLYYRNVPYSSVTNADYGNAISTSGSDVVIGSRIRNDPNDNSGAAFIYRYK